MLVCNDMPLSVGMNNLETPRFSAIVVTPRDSDGPLFGHHNGIDNNTICLIEICYAICAKITINVSGTSNRSNLD